MSYFVFWNFQNTHKYIGQLSDYHWPSFGIPGIGQSILTLSALSKDLHGVHPRERDFSRRSTNNPVFLERCTLLKTSNRTLSLFLSCCILGGHSKGNNKSRSSFL